MNFQVEVKVFYLPERKSAVYILAAERVKEKLETN